MKSKEFKKLLKEIGFKKRTFRIFDKEFDDTVSLEDMEHRIVTRVKALKDRGLKQEEDGSDCDSWTMWTISGVTEEWAVEHSGEGKIPSIRVGRVHQPGKPGHDLVVGIVGDRAYFWNYGVRTEHDPRIMDEVEFK